MRFEPEVKYSIYAGDGVFIKAFGRFNDSVKFMTQCSGGKNYSIKKETTLELYQCIREDVPQGGDTNIFNIEVKFQAIESINYIYSGPKSYNEVFVLLTDITKEEADIRSIEIHRGFPLIL